MSTVKRYVMKGRMFGLGRCFRTVGGDAGLASLVALHDPFGQNGADIPLAMVVPLLSRGWYEAPRVTHYSACMCERCRLEGVAL